MSGRGVGRNIVFSDGTCNPYRYYWECPQTPGILSIASVLPSWLTYARASSQDSVQIGTSLVSTENSAAYDTCPVGRVLDAHKYGLEILPGYTNRVTTSRTWSAWSAKSGGLEDLTYPACDGNNLAYRFYNSAAGGRGRFKTFGRGTAGNACSGWYMAKTHGDLGYVAKARGIIYEATPSLIYMSGGNVDLDTNWKLISDTGVYPSGSNDVWAMSWQATYAPELPTSVATIDECSDFIRIWDGLHYQSWHNTTKANQHLRVASGMNISGNIDIAFRALSSQGAGKPNNPTSNLAIWRNLGEWGYYLPATGQISFNTGAGSMTVPANSVEWNMYDMVRLHVSLIDKRAYLKVNNGETSVIVISGSNPTFSETALQTYIHNNVGTVAAPSSIQSIGICKPGMRPAWTYT